MLARSKVSLQSNNTVRKDWIRMILFALIGTLCVFIFYHSFVVISLLEIYSYNLIQSRREYVNLVIGIMFLNVK